MTEDTPIMAIHAIGYHRRKAYATSTEVDKFTGDYKIIAVVETLAPGQIHLIDAEIAAQLIRQGAARAPTSHELDLRELELRGPRQ